MLRRLALTAGLLLLLLGVLVLVGWVFDVAALARAALGTVAMKANTAAAFVLAGLAICLLAAPGAGGRRRSLAGLLGAAVAVVGALTVVEYVANRDLGIDELLVREGPGAVHTSHPGRMAPLAAAGFALLGVGLVLRARRRAPVAAEGLAVGVATAGLLPLLGYLYGAEPLLGLAAYTRMAPQAALGLLLAAAGMVALPRPGPGARLLTTDDAGGLVARRLLVPVAALPILLGWLRLEGERAGLYGTAVGVALMTLATVLALTSLIAWTAVVLHRRQRETEEMERSLASSEDRLRVLSEANLIGIVTGDAGGRLLGANAAFLDLVGYSREELLSGRLRWRDLTPEKHRATDERAESELRAAGVAGPWEKEYTRKDGSRVPVLVGVSRLAGPRDEHVAFVLDLTERKRLERRMLQAQKMEVVGRLAGGVAHDFNNLLTPILGYATILLERLPQADPARQDLLEIRRAAERGAGLTAQLLAFSRKQILKPVVVDLNTLVENLARLIRRLIGEDISLVLVKAPDLWPVRVDPVQMEQVLLNLAVNARDAMPRGGTLTIETANAVLDDSYAAERAEVEPGPHVVVVVSDTGVGIDESVRSQLFEPFFTTKERGKGTGLGLATVDGIVRQSRGHVWVYSEPGTGSTFKIYLPRTSDDAGAEPERPVPRTDYRGTETVLVVEDDEALRGFTVRALEHYGYRSLAAASAEEALALAAPPAAIDLLLTDVVMPVMSGRELARELLAVHPGTRVLYMSGYTENAIAHHGVLDPGTTLLQKPFTAEDLARAVREALDGGDAALGP